MSLKKRVEQEMKKAMLEKNKERLTALRGIKSQILLAETEKGAGEELQEDVEMKLLTKAAKQRQESAELFKREGREDLYNKEMGEYEVIAEFLPKQLSDEEIETEVSEIIRELGVSDIKEMGRVMGQATKSLAGKADGKKISEAVRKLLS